LKSDALILGTPVHSGYVTALMMIFLERITWTFAKPAKSYLTISGCPLPRLEKKRKSVIIVTSGIIPPFYSIEREDYLSKRKTAVGSSRFM